MENRFLNDWKIVDKVGDGSFGTVYKAIGKNNCLCAIKHISFPRSKEEIDRLIQKGIVKNYYDANNYFIKIVNNEVEIMKRFNGIPYIVDCYELYQENKPDGNGVDFYIRMEYVEDIKTYYSSRLIDVNEVVKLGIDICSALELCQSINVFHNDIKPSNIFIGNDGRYKLGDFGVATENIDLNSFGTLNYVSPEIYKGKGITNSTDLYSLGLVMYKLVSGELPFVTKDIDEKTAIDIRMSGKKIPIIRGVNKKLMDILIKACSFDEKERYKNPTEMKRDLEKLSHINSKKKSIVFNSSSKYEDTVDINDESLVNGNITENIKLRVSDKINIKMIVTICILLVIILFFVVSCSLNRNCEVGYINRNGSCVKGYYYCEPGYSLNADNKCQKTIESIDAKVTYTCKSGYTLNGDVCVNNDIQQPEFVYKCADGFTLRGKKCEKVESADAVITYTCPSGYVSAGDQCVTVANIAATSKYVCSDSSYTLSGTNCVKNVTKTVAATKNYTCDSNGTLNGTVCDYTVDPSYSWPYYSPKCSRGTYNYIDRKCHYSESAKQTYYCSQGNSDGNGNCRYTTVDVKSAELKYTCPSGYAAVGDQCAKTTGVAGRPKYTCADGTELKGKKCYTTVTTDAVGMYSCPDGYVASGATCYQEDFPQAIKKYTCSRVYTLNGGKCEKYEIVPSKAYYFDN